MANKNNVLKITALLVIALMIVTACGNATDVEGDVNIAEMESSGDNPDIGHENGDGDPMTTEVFEGAEVITIVATEFGFDMPSFEVQAGEPVNIMLINDGALEHELKIEEFDFHVHTMPGETAMAGFMPTETGTFQFVCDVPGHFDLGMFGELLVEETLAE